MRGARNLAGGFARGAREVQSVLVDEFDDSSTTLTRIAREAAPRDTGRLHAGITAEVSSGGARVVVTLYSTAVSDEGFPYTDVTRFGHADGIYPVRAKALRFEPGGRGTGFICRAYTRGYHPAHDWVEDLNAGAEAEMDRLESRVGRAIESRIL